MNSKRNRNGKSKRNSQLAKPKSVCRQQFHFRLADPTATSNVGLTVFDRYELDTDLGTLLQSFGNLFEQWTVHSVDFEFYNYQGSTVVGMFTLGFLHDPEDSTPTSQVAMMSLKDVEISSAALANPLRLHVVPQMAGQWLYCKDLVAQTDRLEMFGDMIAASSSYTTANVPGYIICHIDASFRTPINPAIN